MRSNNHWADENYRQRMSVKDWKKILLDDKDKIIFHGRLRQLKSKSLGNGVVEIYKEAINDN